MAIPADANPKARACQSVLLMVDGTLEDFRATYHPGAVNREAKAEPPECRQPGPEGFFATALWLRASFDELAFTVEHVVAEADLVVVDVTMSGRQTGTVVTYRNDGSVDRAFAATGKRVSVTQAHFFESEKASWSSTGRFAITWARPSNSAGYLRALPT